MGGVTLGVHCGDPATGYAADHLEPGASVRHRDPGANMALQFLTCVGNTVHIESGPAAGAVGHVIGQHAYVLVDFAAPVAEQVTTGDAVTVTAVGQGLALPGHPAIVVKNPYAMAVKLETGSHQVYVLHAQPPAFGSKVSVQLVANDQVETAEVAYLVHDANQLVVGVLAERPAGSSRSSCRTARPARRRDRPAHRRRPARARRGLGRPRSAGLAGRRQQPARRSS